MSALLHIFIKLYMNYSCTDSLRKHRSIKRNIIKSSAEEKICRRCICEQRRPGSDCAFAQSDLGLR